MTSYNDPFAIYALLPYISNISKQHMPSQEHGKSTRVDHS
jgi:hypothetical protein